MSEIPAYYAVIPASVRYDSRVLANAKLMYGELTALSSKEGYCYASNGYFSDLYKVSETSITAWVKSLSAAGHIKVTIDKKAGNRRRIYLSNLSCLPTQVNLDTPTQVNLELNSNRGDNNRDKVSEDVFLAELKHIYPYLDIDKQIRDMRAWLLTRPGRKLTRKFAQRWLARQDKPINGANVSTSIPSPQTSNGMLSGARRIELQRQRATNNER